MSKLLSRRDRRDLLRRLRVYDRRGPAERISYGLRLRVDVERPGFEQRGEYLIGQAKRPFGEVALVHSLDGSPHVRTGMQVQRAMLLARVPAGDSVRVHGKVERTGGESHSLHVYAKVRA